LPTAATLRALISPAALNKLMIQRRVSNAGLARVAGCSKANVGHLRTGLIKATTETRARRIEDYLKPRTPLFAPAPASSSHRAHGKRADT
jgi:DNA-binding Xre family transcriptional regulator